MIVEKNGIQGLLSLKDCLYMKLLGTLHQWECYGMTLTKRTLTLKNILYDRSVLHKET